MVPGAVLMVGAAVLVVAGAPKVVAPPVGGPLPAWASRPLGLVETAVGAWALVGPDTGGAWAAAVTYGALSAVMAVSLARHEPDCGCFGRPVAPDRFHLGVDVGFALAGVAAAVGGWRLPEPWWAAGASLAGAFAAAVALVAWLTRRGGRGTGPQMSPGS